ncbi:hypothetical protein ONZ45_g15174 [Pleurotus djamor]|nr:hypothetical protein ONZ45_g15174 [Pleurotus djamor]
MGVALSEGGENHHTEVLQKTAKQIAFVKALTVSNRETFECLRKFCETYKKHKREKAMYKEVIHQASAYVTTINTSISVAKKGMGISRQAADLLDRRDDPKRSVGLMLTMTKEALGDAKTMEAQYRGIREMQRQTAKSLAKGRGSIKAGTKCTDGHLLDETVAVLDQFSLVVGDFVNWWSLLQVDVDRLTASIKYIRNDPEIKSEVKFKRQWNHMEQQYEVYHKWISLHFQLVQEVEMALQELVPKPRIQSWTGKPSFMLMLNLLKEGSSPNHYGHHSYILPQGLICEGQVFGPRSF